MNSRQHCFGYDADVVSSLFFRDSKNWDENVDDRDQENANIDEVINPVGFLRLLFVRIVGIV